MNKHRRKRARGRLLAAVGATVPLAIAATTALAVAAPSLAQTSSSYTAPAEQATDNVALGGCVIRFDTLNWNKTKVIPRIHANAAHYDVGCAGVNVTDSGALRVAFDITAADGVVAMTVGHDETFARWGITCGNSVAPGYELIVCYQDGHRVRADSLKLYSHTANLWLTGTWWRTP